MSTIPYSYQQWQFLDICHLYLIVWYKGCFDQRSIPSYRLILNHGCLFKNTWYNKCWLRIFSSAGRALPRQGRGRRFEPCKVHNSFSITVCEWVETEITRFTSSNFLWIDIIVQTWDNLWGNFKRILSRTVSFVKDKTICEEHKLHKKSTSLVDEKLLNLCFSFMEVRGLK